MTETQTAKTYLVVRDIQSAYDWSIDNGSIPIDGNPDVVLIQNEEEAQSARPAHTDRVICVDGELIGLYYTIKSFQPGIE